MHPLLRAATERQLGLFTAADARRAGYGHPEIRRHLAAGTWARLRRGVYATAETIAAADTAARRHVLDCLAVLLDLGRPLAVVSHGSAARLHGFTVRRDLDPTVRLTDPSSWRHGRGSLVARAPLAAHDLVGRHPFGATAAARTLVDCAREWDLDDSVVAMDAALLAERVTAGDLRSAAAAAGSRPGGIAARRAVGLADGRAESPLASRGRVRMLGAGLPPPELQVEIRAEGRLVGVVDAWFDAAAVAVEFDGKVTYTDPWRGRTPAQVLWEEKRREDELRALGIRVVRVADEDVDRGWPRIETRLRDLLATRGPVSRTFRATPRDRSRRRAG
ncbi:type IV toxin-antitoxin system AbiEi family antitoxin domain-containing protein [Blastococcus montanus]|uniref:type IV toxin-antitoxin system AbiEi family antitoxin domain-containing protein n=1 Tax=Blastococcus montanus TaxID=3144973 RepID=UPI003208C300